MSSTQQRTEATFGSDLIVDILKAYSIQYVAMNPGATIRGIHESLVKYGGNKDPEIIECCHEEIAVAVSHGYTKAAGKLMPVMFTASYGTMHASAAIFNAYVDNVPLILLGGSYPASLPVRNPDGGWTGRMFPQSELIRPFIKWDEEPTVIEAFQETFIQGRRIALTPPMGPVYLSYDQSLQEERLTRKHDLPDIKRYSLPAPIHPDPDTTKRVAQLLYDAQNPVVIALTLGRNPRGFELLIQLAELLSLPVVDLLRNDWAGCLNFPNNHPLDASGTDVLSSSDLVLAIGVKNVYAALTEWNHETLQGKARIRPGTTIIKIGLDDLRSPKGIQGADSSRVSPIDIRIAGPEDLVLEQILAHSKGILERERSKKNELFRERHLKIKKLHDDQRRKWLNEAERGLGRKPFSSATLALELWRNLKDKNWLIGAGTISGWVRRIWEMDDPGRFMGGSGGGSLGYNLGASIGVALAFRDSDRLVIDFQPDGDLLYTPSALWTAAHHNIPLLIVMYNNRAYRNVWQHQIQVSKVRETPKESARIGNELDHPPVDFAALAKSMGCYGEGPVEDSEALSTALAKAIDNIRKTKRPALVDIISSLEL
ncbi:MAG TPA: thiamine pyrophosphate-dependent enzyme [Candidatus Bathyarchaeia archaeon]|nr:thiamine pyrophosphate-dependent enzyme [Candidatus Bathyarchaeia archaeon]